MSFVTVEKVRSNVALVTLNRPDRLNALSIQVIKDLHTALDEVAADRTITVAVLTGAGRGFCAGADLKELDDPEGSKALASPMAGMVTQERLAGLITHLRSIPQPLIAAVNGAAMGGGMALTLGCDIRVAAESARFGVQFINVGVSGCDVGVSYLLPRLIGASRAFELILSGRRIDAAEADRIGLVSRVVADGEVVDAALEVADLIAGHSPFGVWMTKEVMWANVDAPGLDAALHLENRTQILATFVGDFAEAAQAFVEKRRPQFKTWDS
jgi:enoyl-CoA hydratase